MQPPGNGGAAAPAWGDERGPDAVPALASRVAELEAFVASTRELVDERALKELRRTIDALAKRDPKFEERVTQRVSTLADRVETVAKTVSTSSAALAAREGELAQLRRELETRLARLDQALMEATRGPDPGELVTIRRSLDELAKASEQRTPRGLERRVEELAAKWERVAQRLDSVSTTVSTTAAGLAGREGEINALRRAFEAGNDRIGMELDGLRRAVDPTAIADLRQELKHLADETARKQHAGRQLVGQAAAKIDQVAQQLEGVATAHASTTNRVAGIEKHIAALREYLEESGARVNGALGEQRQALATLAARTDALEHADADAARAVDENASVVSARVEDLAARLEPLETAVEASSRRLETSEASLLRMEQRFAGASSRVDALVADLSRALAEFPDPNRIEGALTPRIDELSEKMGASLDELAALAARTAALEEADSHESPVLEERIAGHEEQLSELRSYVRDAGTRLTSLVAEHAQALASLADRTESLERAETDQSVAALAQRVEALAAGIEGAVAGIGEKERALVDLQERFTVSSGRVESVVEDIRDALRALPEPGSETAQDLATRLDHIADRLERFEGASRESTSALARSSSELSRRLELIEERVATVAAELARAKTLWPVALRSLEARLDDVASHGRSGAFTGRDGDAEPSDDLLAELRDNLHAMEGVAAEMSRAADALAPANDEGDVADAGGRIVPLRAGES